MKSIKYISLFLLLGIAFQQPVLAKVSTSVTIKPSTTKQAVSPTVKKSVNKLCHAKGTKYYNQTKKFTAYANLKACLKSGGKIPKK